MAEIETATTNLANTSCPAPAAAAPPFAAARRLHVRWPGLKGGVAREPKQEAYLCPCGQAHVLDGHAGWYPARAAGPCGQTVRLFPAAPILIPRHGSARQLGMAIENGLLKARQREQRRPRR
jgi:hypothetical protein